MNFLGHSLFDFGDEALLVGQFAGDFAPGRDLGAWHPRIATGIRLHRFMDRLTDAHPDMLALRRAFEPGLQRVSGIALDVALDHHLARDWAVRGQPYTGTSLPAHSARVDAVLQSAARHARDSAAPWPDRLEGLRRALIRHRLLLGWARASGVQRTLEGIAARRPALRALAQCGAEIARLDPQIAAASTALLPALHAAAVQWLAQPAAHSRQREPRDPHRQVMS